MARTTYPMTKEEKILKKAQDRLKKAMDADAHNRKEAIEDLKFLNGEQWDSGERLRRKQRGRPVLQINLLPKFVDQVIGDERHNRPRAKVRPVDSRADIQIAKIREGLIASIEQQSNADAIYDQAFEMAVSCGYGAWRVLTRYTEENPFMQEIYLEAIKNPFLVFMDPSSKDATYADAEWGFILEKMPVKEFEEKFPGAKNPGEELKFGQGLSFENWYDKELVTVAEYFVKSSKTITMCQMEDGTVLTEKEAKERIKEWSEANGMLTEMAQASIESAVSQDANPEDVGAVPQPSQPPQPAMPPNPAQAGPNVGPQGMPPMATPAPMQQTPAQGNPFANMPIVQNKPEPTPKPKIVKRRDTEETIIKCYKMTAIEILSEKSRSKYSEYEEIKDTINNDGSVTFPGKYIPIVVVKGKERNIEGKPFVRGLVRDAKDPQRLVNYWNTAAAEVIALAPKSPWVGTAKQFEGYEKDYANANSENFPFLKYNAVSEGGSIVPPPQRVATAQPPVAIFEQIRRGEENLKSVIGLFNSDVGDGGPERTGAAITARQRPGDIGTFVFLDNLSRSIKHSCRIINDMIPYIYDTERDVRLRNVDDTETFAPVNTTVDAALKQFRENPIRYNNLDREKLVRTIRRHGKDAIYNDLTVGKYDVVISVGPSYATARQESATQLLQLVQAMPKQMALAADIIVENLDFKDNDKLARRIRKTLPPNLVERREGEPPPTPQPPAPQIQVQLAKVQLEKEKIKAANAKVEIEKIKLLNQIEQTKGNMKKMMLEILAELHSPEHPGDKNLQTA